MILHSIDTLSEGWEDDDPHVLVVFVEAVGPYDPQKVISFATSYLESWGEEPISARLYSIEPEGKPIAGRCIIGISCEV